MTEDNEEMTNVRISKRHKAKLDQIAEIDKRTAPKEVEFFIDREYDKYPELKKGNE